MWPCDKASQLAFLQREAQMDVSQLDQHLVEWLTLGQIRAIRRYLQSHPTLLAAPFEQQLLPLILTMHDDLTMQREVQYRRLILRQAQQQGGNAHAIDEACVNYLGGFCLPLPLWLKRS